MVEVVAGHDELRDTRGPDVVHEITEVILSKGFSVALVLREIEEAFPGQVEFVLGELVFQVHFFLLFGRLFDWLGTEASCDDACHICGSVHEFTLCDEH